MRDQDRIEQAIADIVRGIEKEFSALRNQDRYAFRTLLQEVQALAWDTEWPHLVLPVLLEEKLNDPLHPPSVRSASKPAFPIIALVA